MKTNLENTENGLTLVDEGNRVEKIRTETKLMPGFEDLTLKLCKYLHNYQNN